MAKAIGVAGNEVNELRRQLGAEAMKPIKLAENGIQSGSGRRLWDNHF